jgi:hypothetical protein
MLKKDDLFPKKVLGDLLRSVRQQGNVWNDGHLIFLFVDLGYCRADRSDLEVCHGRHSYRGGQEAVRGV